MAEAAFGLGINSSSEDEDDEDNEDDDGEDEEEESNKHSKDPNLKEPTVDFEILNLPIIYYGLICDSSSSSSYSTTLFRTLHSTSPGHQSTSKETPY